MVCINKLLRKWPNCVSQFPFLKVYLKFEPKQNIIHSETIKENPSLEFEQGGFIQHNDAE